MAAQLGEDAVLFYLHGVCDSGPMSHLPVFLQVQGVGLACLDPVNKHACHLPQCGRSLLCRGLRWRLCRGSRMSIYLFCLNAGKLSSVFVIEQTEHQIEQVFVAGPGRRGERSVHLRVRASAHVQTRARFERFVPGRPAAVHVAAAHRSRRGGPGRQRVHSQPLGPVRTLCQRGSPGCGRPGFRWCFWKASVPWTENESGR